VFTLDETNAGLVDEDARKACESMDRDLQTALSGVPEPVYAEIASEAHAAYVRSLTLRDEASWRRFFAAVDRAVAAARQDSAGAVAARARLQSFLEENGDLKP
jgi:hypothetical protein